MFPKMLANSAAELVALEPGDVESDYKIQSDNHTLVETPAHTHRNPATIHVANLALDYRTLRSNRRGICHGCNQSQKCYRHVG